MPTLSQITKEIDEVAAKITSLETQIEAQREKLTELVRQQIQIQTETLSHFGMRLAIENARDGYPVEAPSRRGRPRSTTPSTAASRETRERNKAIRAWAADQGIAVKEKGTIPANVVRGYDEANPS